ncbi:MAG: ester cyclase [Actinomycetota bacterium]
MTLDPKAVVSRFYEIVNEGAVEKLDEICAPDLVGHAGAGANLVALKMSISSFRDAFPDLSAELRHVVAEDDLVSTWVNYKGTHGGDFAGVSGSGRPVKFAAWDLIRVADGRIAEITMYCDVFTLMNQIGALPTAAPA